MSARVRLALLALLGSACTEAAAPGDRVVEGVNLDALFAPPTPQEIAAIEEEWAQRDPGAQSVEIVKTSAVSPPFGGAATLHLVSHAVNGLRHYGAVLVPSGAPAGSLPIVLFAHGGDDGINLDATIGLLLLSLGDAGDEFVLVFPSFRSEPLVFEGTQYLSQGAPSPWDRDVDDAIALLNAAIGIVPETDSSRIGVLGLSRGATVGLLMAIRDPRIAAAVEFFGPTDFFGEFTQQVVEEALLGILRPLPGLADLNAQFIQPLKRGELTIQDVRPELLRRSPVYFVSRLPQVQVHHGTLDDVVPVSEAERLIEVMQKAGRQAPEFEHFIYPDGGHDPFSLSGSAARAIAFLRRVLASSTSAASPLRGAPVR
jgi:dipeptidyl aminopeptidase/acylaminoacyl peptidase